MENFSLLSWIIVAILIVLVAGAVLLFARALQNRRPSARSVKETAAVTPVSGPSGFRGWLVLLAIGVIGSPMIMISAFVQSGDLDSSTFNKYPAIVTADSGLYLALIALQICTAFFMARRARRFVSFYIATATAMIVFEPVKFLLTIEIAGLTVGVSGLAVLQQYFKDHDPDPEAITRWVSSSIGLVVWIFYVIRSRRVANTFVR
jgi:Protein of unknown function (DUF2569)